MVRLKARSCFVSLPFPLFQFQMVRLKEEVVTGYFEAAFQFQFQMVRLKDDIPPS